MSLVRVVSFVFSAVFFVSAFHAIFSILPPSYLGQYLQLVESIFGEKIRGGSEEQYDYERWRYILEIAPVILGLVVSGAGLGVTSWVAIRKSRREQETHALELEKLQLQIEQLKRTQ